MRISRSIVDFLGDLMNTLRNLPNSEVGTKVYAEKVRIANSLSPVAVGGSIVAAVITMYALGGAVEHRAWMGWTALIVLCIVLLITLAVGYRMARPTPKDAARWALRYELVATSERRGMVRPGPHILSRARVRGPHRVLVRGSGPCRGRRVRLSVHFVGVPGLYAAERTGRRYSARDDPGAGKLEIATLLAALYAVCVIAAQRMSSTIGDNLQGAFEKQDLLSDLSATQAEMENANQALLSEVEERERIQAALE